MASLLLFSGLAALVAASPVPQAIDLGPVLAKGPATTAISIGAQPTTVVINPTSLASQAAAAVTQSGLVSTVISSGDASLATPEVRRRQDTGSLCSLRPAQPLGAGPVPSPDTASAFLSYAAFAAAASAAPTPDGYMNVFTNLQAENNAAGYLGYTLLDSYDTVACAQKCDAITDCNAFNVAYERDPVVDPDYTTCTNPGSTTNIKCVFWSTPVTKENAVNSGQWRADFQVVVAGSNGYVATSFPATSGYDETYLGSSTINAPLDCNGDDTYMGYLSWNDGQFDNARCAAACTAKSNFNLANGQAQTCQFYNTYILMDNGNTVAQICSLYSETWSQSYAVNTGYTSGNDVYTIAFSLTGSNSTAPGVCTPPAPATATVTEAAPESPSGVCVSGEDTTFPDLSNFCDRTLCSESGSGVMLSNVVKNSYMDCAESCVYNGNCGYFNYYADGRCQVFEDGQIDINEVNELVSCGVFGA